MTTGNQLARILKSIISTIDTVTTSVEQFFKGRLVKMFGMLGHEMYVLHNQNVSTLSEDCIIGFNLF